MVTSASSTASTNGVEFFGYLTGMSEPLRMADFSSHIASAGLSQVVSPLVPVKRLSERAYP